jgi:hypothetical protein
MNIETITFPLRTAEQIGEAMFNGETERMSLKKSENFVLCTMAEINKTPLPEEMRNIFAYQVLDKRLEAMIGQDVVTPWAKVFVSNLCDRVGTVVLYAAALGTMYKQNGFRTVDFNVLTRRHYFGNGFPTVKSLEAIWDRQKNGGGNYIDIPSAWESLKPQEGV